MDTESRQDRPYRSHLHPACLACRKRKSRCKKDRSSLRCAMCQVHETPCISESPHTRGTRRSLRSSKNAVPESDTTKVDQRPSRSSNINTKSRSRPHQEFSSETLVPEHLMGALSSGGDNASHVANSATASDDEALESYFSSILHVRDRSVVNTDFSLSSSTLRGQRVWFTNVQRRPFGISEPQTLAAQKCDLIERLIEPHASHVLDLFFSNSNLCFPLFHEASFRRMYKDHKNNISPALLCNLYANALVYWNNSSALAGHRCPDIRYTWNQANEALHSELFLSPGISTVISIILNVSGRPSTAILGNGGLLGTAVALCNSLGLNRDPSHWSVCVAEKAFRKRIWWSVILLDRWCSLTYGTPLHAHRPQFDVKMLTREDFDALRATTSQDSISIYISLLTLTEILGLCLENIHHVAKSPPKLSLKLTDNIGNHITKWECSLSDTLRQIIFRGTRYDIPGAANLRLAYLSLLLLLRRIHANDKGSQASQSEHSDKLVLKAADDIVCFVQDLNKSELQGFWLSVNASSLTSATMFLLRNALKIKQAGSVITNTSHDGAKRMIEELTKHRQNYSWDIADDCLIKCRPLMDYINSMEDGIHSELVEFEDFLALDLPLVDDPFFGNYDFYDVNLFNGTVPALPD